MKEIKNINLEKYRLLSDTILDYTPEPDDFIGYDRVESFFGSLVPDIEFSDDGNVERINEFYEMYPKIFPTDNRVTSSAVMFSGEFGCGKHTADKLLMRLTTERMSDILDDMGTSDDMEDIELDSIFECYAINISNLVSGMKTEICETVEALMNQIITAAAETPDTMFYFSLGDVTEIMNHKKTANCFYKMVNKLRLNHKTFCILTCCYEGSASRIKDRFKQPFYVYEFEAPSYILRELYFEKIRKYYYNISFEPTDDELATMTEGFTFMMLKKLTAFMLTTVKFTCIDNFLKLDNFFGVPTPMKDDEKITIETIQIENFVNNIKNTKYLAPAKNQIPVYSQPQNIVITQQAAQSVPQTNFDQENNNLTARQKAEMKANKAVESCDTIADWKALVSKLQPASSYLPEDYEKRSKELKKRLDEKVKEKYGEEELDEAL